MLQYEVPALWATMVGAFLILALAEGRWTRRGLTLRTERRWAAHGLLLLAGGVVQAVVFRVGPLVAAASFRDAEWGLLNRPELPAAVQFLGAILLLDLVHYASHRLMHRPVLWRVHEVHHSDADYDVSTAARFHPLEVIISKACYLGAIAVLAPPLVAVFVAELHTALLNVFAHANLALPPTLERVLRTALITPDLHRIHHSLHPADQDRNFGQTFVWWDRLFRTYLPRSAAGEAPATGVAGAAGSGSIADLLLRPFR